MDDFTFLILAAFILIYMILAAVFESTTAPIVLMFTIPLAAIGSLLALLFTSNSLMNANVFVGFIILIGIVVNNSIILIDYTSLLRRTGNRKQRLSGRRHFPYLFHRYGSRHRPRSSPHHQGSPSEGKGNYFRKYGSHASGSHFPDRKRNHHGRRIHEHTSHDGKEMTSYTSSRSRPYVFRMRNIRPAYGERRVYSRRT